MQLIKSLLFYLTFELYRPFKSADFIQKWLNLNEISKEAHQSRSLKRMFPFYFIQIMSIVQISYQIFLICAKFDGIKSVIFLDMLHIFHVDRSMYFLVILQLLMMMYNFQALFNTASSEHKLQIQTILNEQNKKLFAEDFKYKKIPAIVFIKKRMIFVLNLFSSLAYVLGMCLLYSFILSNL